MMELGSNTLCRPTFTSANAGGLFAALRTSIDSGTKNSSDLKKSVHEKLLPLDWSDARPNYWLGGDATVQSTPVQSRPLVMYYQTSKPLSAAALKTDKTCTSSLRMSGVVGTKAVTILPAGAPIGTLLKTKYCPCQKVGVTVSGSAFISYTPNYGAYTVSGYPFDVSLKWTKAVCTVLEPLVTVKYAVTGGTEVKFTCKIESGFVQTSYGTLTITPHLTPGSSQTATPVFFLLKSCDCTNKYAQVGDPTCSLTSGVNNVTFPADQTSIPPCTPSPPPTGETQPTNPPPNETSPPAPSASPGASPPPNAPQPTGVPTRTNTPVPSISSTQKPTDKDAQKAQGTDDESQNWLIYLYIGLGVVTLVAVAAGIGLVIWCYSSMKNNQKKQREQIKQLKSQ